MPVYGTAVEQPADPERSHDSYSRREQLQRATGLLAVTFLLISGAIWTNSLDSLGTLGEIPHQQLSAESYPSKLAVNYTVHDDGLYTPSSDPDADRSVRALLTALVDVSNSEAIMFGHMNTNVEGQYFYDADGEDFNSDVANVTGGEFPAVVGYDLKDILGGHDRTVHAKAAYAAGSVITVYWLAQNPVTGGDAEDCSGSPITALLPGGSANEEWTTQLGIIANFFKGLTHNGVSIPVIFRPLHECDGQWYWWGSTCSTGEDYTRAWRYTQSYLRDELGVHNLLYIFSPDKISWFEEEAFEERYPGSNFVDLIGNDRYDTERDYTENSLSDCRVLVKHAHASGKVVAMSESGIFTPGVASVSNKDWFTDSFLEAMANDEECRRIAYVMTWTNFNPERYWVPLAGDNLAASFLNMYQGNSSIFAADPWWVGLQNKYSIGIAAESDSKA